jgi:membrane protease subunit HflC
MTRLLIGLAAIAFLIWLAMASLFTIGQSQQALVVRLGQPVAALTDPGLHLKAPLIDTVQYYDNRLLQLEPGVQQIILGDQKRIEVETYARFRIVDPLRYFQSVGTDEQARSQLSQMISAYLRRELGQVMLPALLSQQRDAITEKIRAAVASDAKPLGIEVVDVRIRRADLPVETSQAIYDRMMSERNREAKELRAQGFEWAQQIRANMIAPSCSPRRSAMPATPVAGATRRPTASAPRHSARIRRSTICTARSRPIAPPSPRARRR